MNQRRAFLASTALIAPALVAACALSPATVSSVETVIAKIQAFMPYVSGIVSIVGLVVPGATTTVNLVQAGLSTASTIFANLTSTMSTAQAQPIVGQIVTVFGSVLTNAKTVIAALPANTQTQANALLAEAETILSDLNAFAGLAAAPAYLATTTAPVHMFVRAVK